MAMQAASLTGDTRPLTGASSDGRQWLLNRLQVSEHVCRCFSIEADLLYDQPQPPDLLGQTMAINYRPGLQERRQEQRCFHGVITDIVQLHSREADNLHCCRLILRPWLQLLDLRENCRIFQNQTSKAIISAILAEHSLSGHCRFQLSGELRSRVYCVQYNETDYAFIDRLLREDGLHWYFQHSKDRHTLIIGDSNQAFTNCCDNLEYYRTATDLSHALVSWQPHLQVQTNTLSTGSYREDQAQVIDSGDISSRHQWHSNLQLAAYRFVGHGRDRDQASHQARNHIEARDSQHLRVRAGSHEPRLTVGGTFHLARHPDQNQIRDYLLVSINHSIHNTETGHGLEYSNRFLCQPLAWPYRPAPAAPVRIPGLQTATVTGADGSETHTDDQGRIRVRFHWDHEDNPDDNSSCWLRVVQPLAGDGFGGHSLPRVGQEVLVGFLDGDPEQPVVMGCLYNGKLTIPDPNAATGGLLSRTTPSVGSDHANELRLDDTQDNELLYLQAQKDMTTLVRNDRSSKIEGKDTLEVTGESLWQCQDKLALTVDKTLDAQATDALSLSSKAAITCEASQSLTCKAGTDGHFDAGTSLTLSAPQISLAGQTSITLKVGASTLSLGPASIEISAPQIAIKGQASAEMEAVITRIKGSAKVDISGTLASLSGRAIAQVSCPAIVQVQGGLAKIN